VGAGLVSFSFLLVCALRWVGGEIPNTYARHAIFWYLGSTLAFCGFVYLSYYVPIAGHLYLKSWNYLLSWGSLGNLSRRRFSVSWLVGFRSKVVPQCRRRPTSVELARPGKDK
jgi:hypothetical protein